MCISVGFGAKLLPMTLPPWGSMFFGVILRLYFLCVTFIYLVMFVAEIVTLHHQQRQWRSIILYSSTWQCTLWWCCFFNHTKERQMNLVSNRLSLLLSPSPNLGCSMCSTPKSHSWESGDNYLMIMCLVRWVPLWSPYHHTMLFLWVALLLKKGPRNTWGLPGEGGGHLDHPCLISITGSFVHY